jgi:hypothetical protein
MDIDFVFPGDRSRPLIEKQFRNRLTNKLKQHKGPSFFYIYPRIRNFANDIAKNSTPGTIRFVVNGEKPTGKSIHNTILNHSPEHIKRQHTIVLGNYYTDKQQETFIKYDQGGTHSHFWKPFGCTWTFNMENFHPSIFYQSKQHIKPFNERGGCLYLASHVITQREQLWDMVSSKIIDCVAGGECNGVMNKCDRFRYPKNSNWQGNIDIFEKYKIAYSPDNAINTIGYVTEKIFVSLAAGCVPIYSGFDNISEILNPESFIHATNDRSLKSDKNAVGFNNIKHIISKSNKLIKNEKYFRELKHIPPMSKTKAHEFFGMHQIIKHINNNIS